MGCDVCTKPSKRWMPTGKAPTKQESVSAPPSSNKPSSTIKKTNKSQKRYKEKLSDLVKDRYLTNGDKLAPSIKNGYAKRHSGEGIIIEENGEIFIEIRGELYSSPSGAAQALSGNASESGWEFWERSSDGKTLFEIRAKYRIEVRD